MHESLRKNPGKSEQPIEQSPSSFIDRITGRHTEYIILAFVFIITIVAFVFAISIKAIPGDAAATIFTGLLSALVGFFGGTKMATKR
jgi:hypothetical protein